MLGPLQSDAWKTAAVMSFCRMFERWRLVEVAAMIGVSAQYREMGNSNDWREELMKLEATLLYRPVPCPRLKGPCLGAGNVVERSVEAGKGRVAMEGSGSHVRFTTSAIHVSELTLKQSIFRSLWLRITM